MSSTVTKFLVIFCLMKICSSQLGTPPKVEKVTLLLESYIPPAMQMMAYLTEMMKYDLKPTTAPPYGPTTTSTIKPTPFHRPGVYAPLRPPGPDSYYQSLQKGNDYRDYIASLQRPSGLNYFDRYKQDLDSSKNVNRNPRNIETGEVDRIFPTIAEYFGRNFLDTYKLGIEVEKDDVPNNIEENPQDFLKKYDDLAFTTEFRQKRVPPTRAYVTLLSLYDMLNKESKRLGLSKYQGYTERMLKELADISTGTSSYQLLYTLKKLIEHRDTNRADILKKVKQLITDLEESNSYINMALQYIPPLSYAL
ncbi:uncharacterized protein LOC130897066 [Diorhabda carinulata]|uniref:uncharacterized protein LOC130897066 n=1 Tax=Diorhabda carinulata TaxID=1163345 RepID=UPI0025A2E1F0|nr:uncharacterized protein LOC130897066 [Diorhabda carinulata]